MLRFVSAEETVQRIVDGTRRCLVEKGYTGTTISDIAEAAQVSRGALTHHFATKEELILEVLNRVIEGKANQFLHALPKEASLARVDYALDVMFENYTKDPIFIVYLDLWTQARWNPRLRELIRKHYRQLRKTIANVVDRDFASLGPIADGETVGMLLMVVVEGIALQYLTDPETVPASRLLQMMKAAARLLFVGAPTQRTPQRQS